MNKEAKDRAPYKLARALGAAFAEFNARSWPERLSLAGFALYAVFAPHSIAGAEIALLFVAISFLIRLVKIKSMGLRRTTLNLPIWLFFLWTILSAVFSEEPRTSLLKLQSTCVFLLFYLAQSMLTHRTAVFIVALMITSACAGALWSAVDLARGRGVVIESLSAGSPFRAVPLTTGDAIWRVAGKRISSVREIDELIRRAESGTHLPVSIISQGEHDERTFLVTDEIKNSSSPSGITSLGPTHNFRASGWTRHYETFSETLQILAQLALGLALANFTRNRTRSSSMALAASLLLTIGIALTAMRTVLVALACGALIIAWRASNKRARLLAVLPVIIALSLGALFVWRTRASEALFLNDASSSLRLAVARVGLLRIGLHPIFGHGMDAIKNHWTQWGFPGATVIHLHSTPLEIAFERGLPALIFWLWIIGSFWRFTSRAEKVARRSDDANRHGILLGATGALAGFFLSSLVNYNFGDGEVALVFWWLMGTVVVESATHE